MLGEVLTQIFGAAIAVVVGRRAVKSRTFVFALFATVAIVLVYTFLIYTVRTADEVLGVLWMATLAASPVIVIVLVGLFSVLDTVHRRAEVQFLHFVMVCAVPVFILALAFAVSYLSNSY